MEKTHWRWGAQTTVRPEMHKLSQRLSARDCCCPRSSLCRSFLLSCSRSSFTRARRVEFVKEKKRKEESRDFFFFLFLFVSSQLLRLPFTFLLLLVIIRRFRAVSSTPPDLVGRSRRERYRARGHKRTGDAYSRRGVFGNRVSLSLLFPLCGDSADQTRGG